MELDQIRRCPQVIAAGWRRGQRERHPRRVAGRLY
ncbi:hypothetical protein LNQ52_00535 [Klebsiella pneumoniae subsp. pneumoniae]|nr:hypothetical protein [Klebsiella pneumoniae subsp. pneumoniae]